MSTFHVALTAASLAAALCAARHAIAQPYTFTTVADSTADKFDPFSLGTPSISDLGHVAFSGQTADFSLSFVLRTGPALAGPFTTIVDDAIEPDLGAFFRNVSVNNLGQVAVWTPDDADDSFERIIRGDGGPITTIARATEAGPFNFMSVVVSLNDSGTVAWQGELLEPGFPQGLFTGDGGPHNTIFSTATSKFDSSFAGPMINNAGQIAFRASLDSGGGDAIFRYDGGDTFTVIADATGPFNAAFDDEPAINNLGVVALLGRSDDNADQFIIIGDGASPPTPLVDTTGPLEGFSALAINDSGDIAFLATFDDFTNQAIFSGPDLINDRVVGTGDLLDGSTIVSLSMFREGFNNIGQIAFLAGLEDGRSVIVVADPIPTPGALMLGALAAPCALLRRRHLDI